jgi:hypothetical protein
VKEENKVPAKMGAKAAEMIEAKMVEAPKLAKRPSKKEQIEAAAAAAAAIPAPVPVSDQKKRVVKEEEKK